jgi:release factor glutamine methyltransferase
LTTVASVLSEAEAVLSAQTIDTARLDAEVLLGSVLGVDRAGVFSRLAQPLSSSQCHEFWRLIQRRAKHEPLQYITGVREFWSLEFRVTPDVLIPRPETEILVETVLQLLSQTPSLKPQASSRLLDIGTGSGCIAITLAKELPQAELWAVDISPAALAVARENAQRHGVEDRIRFLQGDVFAPLSNAALLFDVIVSNPPYIARPEFTMLQPEVSAWEPRAALDGGIDGLDFYRRLVKEGQSYLRSGGWLVLELGAGQFLDVQRLIQAQRNLTVETSVRDYAGHERVIVAYRV